MKNEQLYHKTVNTLVEAYFKDELAHGKCNACAVRNICGFSEWKWVFCTDPEGQKIRPDFYNRNLDGCKDLIDSTGYTWQELAKIEYAFETAPRGNSDEDWMFNGLMAVVEVLDIIHENTDTNITTQTKTKFYETHPTNRIYSSDILVR